jgi:hypothetical protein
MAQNSCRKVRGAKRPKKYPQLTPEEGRRGTHLNHPVANATAAREARRGVGV